MPLIELWGLNYHDWLGPLGIYSLSLRVTKMWIVLSKKR